MKRSLPYYRLGKVQFNGVHRGSFQDTREDIDHTLIYLCIFDSDAHGSIPKAWT